MAWEYIFSAANQTSNILADQSHPVPCGSLGTLCRSRPGSGFWKSQSALMAHSTFWDQFQPKIKQNLILIWTNAPLSSPLEMFRSRVLVQVHLGENIRKDLSRAASRGTGSKTGGILLLSLSFDKLAGSKRSCDQMTKQRSSFSLLIMYFCIISQKTPKEQLLSEVYCFNWSLCASRGCSREKSPIPPLPILPQSTLCHRTFINGWWANVWKSTTLTGTPKLDLSEIG